MKTINPKKENIKQKWFIIDGKDKVLGRLASTISIILQGKNTVTFAPYLPGGAWIIVINAKNIKITGRKNTDKLYWKHTGYPGGIKNISYKNILEKKPDFPLKKAVKGMLPSNILGKELLSRLKIYASSSHPHKMQKPEVLEI